MGSFEYLRKPTNITNTDYQQEMNFLTNQLLSDLQEFSYAYFGAVYQPLSNQKMSKNLRKYRITFPNP